MKNNFVKNLFIILLNLFLIVSCAKKQKAKQHFTLNIGALQTGLPLSGGSYVKAISSTSNNIIKLDSNDSAVFEFGNWEFQVVSFEGPTPFYGKRYCGKISNFNLDISLTNAELSLNQMSCLSEPFVSLISEINNNFANNSFLTVTGLSPDESPLGGGANLTIKGTAFVTGAIVDIGGAICSSPIVVNPSTITCTNTSNSAGRYNVTVTNIDTQSAILSNAFIYRGPPTVNNVSLSSGSLAGLTSVTITGTGFYAGSTVTFDGIQCTLPIVLSSTTIVCTTPPHSAGTVDVIVTNADSQSGTLVNGYKYQPAPTVSNIALNSGSLSGGTAVTITGTDFLSGAVVSMGGSPCISPNVVSSTSITCTTTAHAAGAVNVVVTNIDMQSGIALNGYIYRLAPTISSIAFNSGSLAGGTSVTITGSGFYFPTVTFDGVPATDVVFNSANSIACVTPAHSAGVVDVVVTNNDTQSNTGVGFYTYRAAPTISSVTPNFGDIVGGTAVTISGSGFVTGASVHFGGAYCSSTNVLSGTSISCITAAHASGLVTATVTNPDTQIGNLASAYTYKDVTPPNMSGIAFNDGTTEWSTSASPIFTWNAATDSQSGVSYYEIAIGTTSGGTDVQSWTSVGNVTSYQFTGLSLTKGQSYFASIRATDVAGNTSSVFPGNGWFVRNEMWVTDGNVLTTALVGNTLYIGGNFATVGEWSGGGVPLDTSTGATVWPAPLNRARVSGRIYASIPDGSGGYYIGGNFKAVAGVIRNNLAHILSDGSLDSWNPNVNDIVFSLTKNGSSLYVGGNFTTVNGSTTRNHLAAIDVATGTATSWDPNLNDSVLTMSWNGSNLYVGGKFTLVNGSTTRFHLAAIDLSTGVATSWNPNVGDVVKTLVINGSTIYIGGHFTTVNSSTTRNHLAAIDLATGLATSWDPNISDDVNALAINGSNIYVGGTFIYVNGSTLRNHIAAIDLVSGTTTSWDPSISGYVYSLAIDSSYLYVGGNFSGAGASIRKNLVAIDLSSGLATSWNPKISNSVYTLTLNGSVLYAGGEFTTANNSVSRSGLAAIDLITGTPTSWNPTVNNIVYSMIINGSNLYAGGYFTTANGGTNRNYLAAFDLTTGIATSWNPNLNGPVFSIAINGTILYAGGNFSITNGGTARNNLAAFDLNTGVVTTWNPNISNYVNTLLINGTSLYVGGSFTFVNGGTTRNHLAAFNLSTGALTSWNPNSSGEIYVMAASGSNLYVGGGFTLINGGTSRNYLAALNLSTGTVTSWNPNINGPIKSLALNGTTIFAGGYFSVVNGGIARNYLVALDLTTGAATSFNAEVGSSDAPATTMISGLSLYGSTLYVGGGFTSAGRGSHGFTLLDTTTGLWPSSF